MDNQKEVSNRQSLVWETFAIIFILVFFISSCSFVSKYVHYQPINDTISMKYYWRTESNSTPVLASKGIKEVYFYCSRSKYILAGPAFLPIIPGFIAFGFEKNPLTFLMMFEVSDSTLKSELCKVKKLKLLINNGRELEMNLDTPMYYREGVQYKFTIHRHFRSIRKFRIAETGTILDFIFKRTAFVKKRGYEYTFVPLR